MGVRLPKFRKSWIKKKIFFFKKKKIFDIAAATLGAQHFAGTYSRPRPTAPSTPRTTGSACSDSPS